MDSQDVRFYLSVFLRRLHYFLLPLVAVTLAGCLIAFKLPPGYVAIAKILVESPRVSANLESASAPAVADPVQQLQVVEQQLTTRASLLAMAEKFAIYPAAGVTGISDDEIADDMRARTKVEPVEFSNLGSSSRAVAFAISFEARDPVLAADVANAYAKAILEANARERKARADDALEFFRHEVDRLGAALNQAQDAILRFKREHKDALPDSLEFRRMQQTTYDERLRQLQREQVSLQERRSAINQILATPTTGGRAPTADEQTLADLQRGLAEQQAIFSEDSPNLQMLRSRIEAIEKRLAERRAEPVDVSQRKDVSPELRIQFADISGQLEFIAQEQESVKRTLADLARSTGDTETNSTVLGALQRTYETTQARYSEATSRLAEASTRLRIETEAVGQKFTMVETAAPPRNPIRPKRRLIALGSLAAGIGLGFGLVVAVEFWAASIRRPAELASAFPGQPFATIPYILSGGEMLRRRIRTAVLVVVLLASIPGLLFVSKYLPPPIGTASNSVSTGVGAGQTM